VVTGAASGIGRELTRQLLAEGARVVMADVEAGALDAAATDAATLGEVLAVVVDVRDPAALDALAARTAEHFGGPAQLVFANAGVSVSGALWDMTPDDWNWALGVNVIGVANTVRSFVAPLVASGLPGHVCITGSVAGYTNQPGFGAYNATKHAVTAIAETLAAELRDAGHPIGVTLLAPWFVSTNIANAGRNRPADLTEATEAGELMRIVRERLAGMSPTMQQPEEIAALALAGMKAGRFAVFTFEPATEVVRKRFETVLAGGVLGAYTAAAEEPPLWKRPASGPDLGPRTIIHIDETHPAELIDGSTPAITLKPLVGEDCDLCVMTFEFPPGYVGVVHSHPEDTVYLVRRGEFIVDGEGTFLPGDLRWVKAGTMYGPERAGAEGCEVVLVTKGGFPPKNGTKPDEA